MTNLLTAFNSALGAPKDEVLGLVSDTSRIISTPDAERGYLHLQVSALSGSEIRNFHVTAADDTLSLGISDFQLTATSWHELGGKILMHPPSTFSFELAALFQQVGGAPEYQGYFRLKLNP